MPRVVSLDPMAGVEIDDFDLGELMPKFNVTDS